MIGKFKQHPAYAPVTIYRSDISMAWCIQRDGNIYMANVWVHPDYRGSGVGAMMMKEIKSHFEGMSVCSDYTDVSKGFWETMKAEGIIDNIIHERIDFDWIKVK